jgi:hypothetical protein
MAGSRSGLYITQRRGQKPRDAPLMNHTRRGLLLLYFPQQGWQQMLLRRFGRGLSSSHGTSAAKERESQPRGFRFA